jgi:hypothetical protein
MRKSGLEISAFNTPLHGNKTGIISVFAAKTNN